MFEHPKFSDKNLTIITKGSKLFTEPTVSRDSVSFVPRQCLVFDKNLLSCDGFYRVENVPKPTSAWASPRMSLGRLTALPETPS